MQKHKAYSDCELFPGSSSQRLLQPASRSATESSFQAELIAELRVNGDSCAALQLTRGLRATSRSHPNTGLDATELVRWIVAGGGCCEGVQIVVEDELGHSLTASQATEAGKVLVSLPRSRQLTCETLSPTLRLLVDKVPPDLWPARLALPLIAERAKGEQSSYLPYLRSLPAGISGLPLFYSPQELSQLQYPPLVRQITMRCRWLLKFSSDELATADAKYAFSGVAVDANLLGWGLGCASSRAFKLGGSTANPRMLPLIDLCNHSFSPNCKLESQADGSIRLVACGDIQARAPLEIDYGELSNTVLLQDYGFIVPDNPYDDVQMALSVDQIQVAQTLGGVGIPREPESWQEAMLRDLGATGQGCSVNLSSTGQMFDWRLVAAVRTLCAQTSEDLEGRNGHSLGSLAMPLSAGVESRVMRTLAAMSAQLIAAMGTKLEEDRRLLSADAGLSPNIRLAIRYRMQLKRMMQAAMALVLSKLKTLQSPV